MKRKLSKYSTTIISSLLALLVHAHIQSILSHDQKIDPYIKTALSLAVAIFCFYVAFYFSRSYVKYINKRDEDSTQRFKRSSFIGLLIGLITAVFLLFMSFAQVWYSRNLIDDLRNWISSF